MIDRDHALERNVLERVSRIAQEAGFAEIVIQRLNDVEQDGGPDGEEVTAAAAAFAEARDEMIDGAAWTVVGLHHLAAELAEDFMTAQWAGQVLEEAMAHAAHAAHLFTDVLAELQVD